MNTRSDIHPLFSHLVANTTYQFWFLQVMYWFGLSVISFISLTLWYAEADWQQTAHVILQSVEGLALSMGLHYIFRASWNKSLTIRICINIVSIIIVATLWTAIRMLTFLALIYSEELWQEFGGWYFSSIIVFLAWSALYYGFNYYKLLQKEHENALQAQTMAKEAQLKMLRYQLNPHFLFNTFNSISALIKINESQKAQQMVQQLSQFFRLSLDIDAVQPITLEQEIDILSIYLDIEKVRFSDRLEIKFNISEESKSALVPSFLLQPLIENAIKYAISPSETGGKIEIDSQLVNEDGDHYLKIIITDSGPGESSANRINGQRNIGVGLRNTEERLAVLYGTTYEFKTCNAEPNGFRVKLILPYYTDAAEFLSSKNEIHRIGHQQTSPLNFDYRSTEALNPKQQ